MDEFSTRQGLRNFSREATIVDPRTQKYLRLVPTLALALAKALAAYGFSLGVSNAEDARVSIKC